MLRICQIVLVLMGVLWPIAARAAECHKTLPMEERLLSAAEVRQCVEPRARAIVALHLLGERVFTWKDYGSMFKKCTGPNRSLEPLSDDPVVWAAQVSTCPSPKNELCGCPPTVGTQFMPGNARASSIREANMKLIQREGALATRNAKQNCQEIEARLRAMRTVSIRASCSNLR